jgi:hypothetical protein
LIAGVECSALRVHLFRKAAKQAGKPTVPLVPVVTPWDGVKFVTEVTLRKQCGEFAVRWEQSLLLPAGKKKVRRGFGIRGSG